MESNYNFGLLCNSVFCKSEEFFKIRRDILSRSGFKIKLVANSDINFTNIFGRNFSNCWLFFDVLKESDSLLSRVNYLINYLKKNNFPLLCIINFNIMCSIPYLKKHMILYNSDNWKIWNLLFLLNLMSKFIRVPFLGHRLVNKSLRLF